MSDVEDNEWRKRFFMLVDAMCGALRLDEEQTADANNWPLINLPEIANGIANELESLRRAATTLPEGDRHE